MSIISPFEALVILAKKYRSQQPTPNSIEINELINKLLLSGVSCDDDLVYFEVLLQDECLNDLKIATFNKEEEFDDDSLDQYEVINNDPIRRYFESMLCHETLRYNLDRLDSEVLIKHYNETFEHMPFYSQLTVPSLVFAGEHSSAARSVSSSADETIAAIRQLRSKNRFQSLGPDNLDKQATSAILENRKAKVLLLVKTSYAAMTAIHSHFDQSTLPLDLYHEDDSIYKAERRGRVPRENEQGEKQTVRSRKQGIMRSFNPLPEDHILNSGSGRFVRPPDRSTYVRGTEVPEATFSKKVMPYVNSISGFMLCYSRVLKILINDNQFVYKDNYEQFHLFIKNFISTLILTMGGHTLNELMMVLKLDKVQEALSMIEGFTELDLKTLFQDTNQDAFNSALEHTIHYQEQLEKRSDTQIEILFAVENRNSRLNLSNSTAMKPIDSYKLFTNGQALKEQTLSELINKASDQDHELVNPFISIDDEYILNLENQTFTMNKHQMTPLEIGGVTRLEKFDVMVDSIWSILVDKKSSQQKITQAKQKLLTVFNITINNIEMAYEKLAVILKQRKKDKLLRYMTPAFSGKLLQERLDDAYDVLSAQDTIQIDKDIAKQFICYILDIDFFSLEAIELINKSFAVKNNIARFNPEFIPGISPFGDSRIQQATLRMIERTTKYKQSSDLNVQELFQEKILLDVTTRSKIKDSGGKNKKGHKALFFSPIEVEQYQSFIYQGQFMINDELADTKNSHSHGKAGFASIVVDANGRIKLFNHINYEKTGIAHSSFVDGKPVFFAGEVQIDNGTLKSITTYSGHYRPSLYNVYNLLEHFVDRGININDVKIFTFKNPSNALEITASPSFKNPTLYESKAIDLLDSFRAKIRTDLQNAQDSINTYQLSRRGFWYRLFHNTTLTDKKLGLADNFNEIIKNLELSLDQATNIDDFNKILDQMKTSTVQTSFNNQIYVNQHSWCSVGALSQKLMGIFEQANTRSEELSNWVDSNGQSKKSHSIEVLRNMGRPQK